MASSAKTAAAPARWQFHPPPAIDDSAAITALARALNLTPIAARLLVRRGIATAKDADAFLTRRFDLMHDPMLLPDIEPAIARIAKAVDKGDRILLFGDYDADGITATSLLARFFDVLKKRSRGKFEVEARVPERKFGYGLSPQAVEEIRARKPNLLITLDNGISAHDALDQLAADGIDCIVVDHHHVHGALPRAVAVINPKRHDSKYPFNELCGAGISFKLAWALAVHFSQNKKVTPEFRAFLLDAVALAGMGTIADIVPLVDENRVLAHQGLVALNRTQSPGLRALIDASKLSGPVKASDVGFRLAPRLNAAGRCGEVSEALELLLTDNPARAAELAAMLDGYNSERQDIQSRIAEEARTQALNMLEEIPERRALVLGSADWHHGVIGIVASRIVEEFHRPALLLSIDAQTKLARGSGRSIRGLHLAEALGEQKEMLLTFGGHAAAAGLSLNSENIDAFRLAFEKTAMSLLKAEDLVPKLRVDEKIRIGDLTEKLCFDLDQFEPFGMGNPRPTFAVIGVLLSSPPRVFGKTEEHLSFFARHEKATRRVVGFGCGEQLNMLCDLMEAGPIDVAFRPQLNTFRGETAVEMVMDAFRRSEN